MQKQLVQRITDFLLAPTRLSPFRWYKALAISLGITLPAAQITSKVLHTGAFPIYFIVCAACYLIYAAGYHTYHYLNGNN